MGVPRYPFKMKDKLLCCATSNMKKKNTPGRPIGVLKAAYNVDGNTAPTSILGNAEDFDRRVECRAGKGSIAGLQGNVSSPSAWSK